MTKQEYERELKELAYKHICSRKADVSVEIRVNPSGNLHQSIRIKGGDNSELTLNFINNKPHTIIAKGYEVVSMWQLTFMESDMTKLDTPDEILIEMEANKK